MNIDPASAATQPLWLVLAGSVITAVLIPLFNLVRPYILTAEQREARADRLREKSPVADSEELTRLRAERDAAITRFEAEFKARMELIGDHKFVVHKLAEMELRHDECEARNREMEAQILEITKTLRSLQGMISPPAPTQ
jgi:hypothetical protein